MDQLRKSFWNPASIVAVGAVALFAAAGTAAHFAERARPEARKKIAHGNVAPKQDRTESPPKESDSANLLQAADRALEEKDYAAAREFLEQAAKLGVAPERTAPAMRRALGTGRLTLETGDRCADVVDRMLVESRPLGKTPLLEIDIAVGPHLLEVRSETGRVHLLPITVDRMENGEGQAVRLSLDLQIPDDQALVPEGPFTFGGGPAPAVLKTPQNPREIRTTGAFLIDVREVTNAQYKKFLDDLPNALQRRIFRPVPWEDDSYPDGAANIPVAGVSDEGARAYAVWIGARLPTETEWEKAARGPDGRIYPWGDDPSRIYSLSRSPAPDDGDTVDLSPYGVRSMSGGVAEWTWDPGKTRSVVRGGFWTAITLDDGPLYYRTDFVGSYPASVIGFRCARSVLPSEVRTSPAKLIPLCSHPDQGVRMAALNALCTFEGEEACNALIGAVADPCPEVARTACRSLLRRRLPHPFDCFDKRQIFHRERAAACLLFCGETSGRDFLLTRFDECPDTELRERIGWDLAWAGDPEGMIRLYQVWGEAPALCDRPEFDARKHPIWQASGGADFDLKMLNHKTGAVRRHAVFSLGRTHSENSFLKLIELKRNDPSDLVRAEAARSLARKGDPEAVVEKTTALLKLEPRNAPVLLDRAIAYHRLGRLDDSLDDLSRALEIDPTLDQAHYLRGVIHAGRGEPEKAKADFDRAIQLQPASGEAYAGRGHLQLSMKHSAEAAQDFSKSLRVGVASGRFHSDNAEPSAVRAALRQATKPR